MIPYTGTMTHGMYFTHEGNLRLWYACRSARCWRARSSFEIDRRSETARAASLDNVDSLTPASPVVLSGDVRSGSSPKGFAPLGESASLLIRRVRGAPDSSRAADWRRGRSRQWARCTPGTFDTYRCEVARALGRHHSTSTQSR